MQSLIIITDSFPAANGGGICQTLYNLFDNWKGKIYVVCRPGEQKIQGPVLDATVLEYTFEKFRNYSTRLLRSFNTTITKANFQRQQHLKVLPAIWPNANQAKVLVSTTEPIKLHLAWLLQKRFGYDVIPYFMDDWMADNTLTWKGNSIQAITKDLLKAAPCWLMISTALEQILTKRYNLAKKPCFVVHNPSPVADKHMINKEAEVKFTTDQKSEISNLKSEIIYAGSIWPMHFDALQAVAKAVHILNSDKYKCNQQHKDAPVDDRIKLLIYTSASTWNHNRSHLEGAGVIYGGFVPYQQMQEKFAAGWLLLATASFSASYEAFTNSSVQTKLTDYMAARKPILVVSPVQGASAQFVHEWDCGYSINSSNPEDIATQLLTIQRMALSSEKKAVNGYTAATTVFSKPVVQEKLYRFLDNYAGFEMATNQHNEAIPV